MGCLIKEDTLVVYFAWFYDSLITHVIINEFDIQRDLFRMREFKTGPIKV